MAQGEQGWRSDESTRLPPIWPGFESWRRRHMWVEFVVGSLPCSERLFSGYSGFPLSLKTNTFKFQFDLERTEMFQRVLMNSLVLVGKQITIYNFFYKPGQQCILFKIHKITMFYAMYIAIALI